MNTKIRKLMWALLAAVLAGCGGERAERESDEGHEAGEVELFEKNRGVRLPPELQRELGLATVEAAEKSVTPRVEKMAQVYRAAAGSTPAGAVAWLNDAESKEVRVGQSVELRAMSRPLHDPRSSRREEAHSSAAESQSLLTSAATVQQNNIASGTLVRLEKSSSAALGQVEVLIEFNDAGKRFPAGSSLVVTFTAERAYTALAVPESAVIHSAGGAFVYAANGEHFIRTPVKPGAEADGWVEIMDGLYAGDIVAAKAADSLWLIELCALKGGTPCCPASAKKRDE